MVPGVSLSASEAWCPIVALCHATRSLRSSEECATAGPENQHAANDQGDGTVLAGSETTVSDVDLTKEVQAESERGVEQRQQTDEKSRVPPRPPQGSEHQSYRSGVERLFEAQVVADDARRVPLTEDEISSRSWMIECHEAAEPPQYPSEGKGISHHIDVGPGQAAETIHAQKEPQR